jgi:hypothetical protein
MKIFLMNRAPADCRQYFTGTSGTVMSYNFAGNQMLQSQIYTNCFRQELGNLNYLCLNNIIKVYQIQTRYENQIYTSYFRQELGNCIIFNLLNTVGIAYHRLK